jgi:hypothetical protein
MRYYLLHILVVTVLLSLSSPLLAQKDGVDGEGTPPCLVQVYDDVPVKIDRDSIVFRCVLPGERPAQKFTITNLDNKTVTIEGFRLIPDGPGPFAIPLLHRHIYLAPGESYTDSVRFVPIGSGMWRADLEIGVSSGGRRPVIHLYGETSPDPQAVPDQRPLIFGSVPVGDTIERCVVITNPACRDLIISDISIDLKMFHLTTPRSFPDTLRAGQSDTLCVEFAPRYAADESGFLRIAALNGSGTDIPLHGTAVSPGLVAWPYTLNLREVIVGDTGVAQFVAVCNRGNTDAMLDNWQLVGADSSQFIVDPPPVSVQLHANAVDTVWFRVRFAPVGTAGPRSAEIRFNNLTDGPAVFLSGNALAPAIGALPAAIDMGSVDVGGWRLAPDTIVVSNAITRQARVVGLAVTGPDSAYFRLRGTIPDTIDPSASSRYGVVFSPDAAREYAAQGNIILSTGYVMQVALTGRGLAPDSRRFWVDSASANVNDRFELDVHVDPPLTADDAVSDYAVTIAIDPRAFFLHGVVDDGGAPTVTYVTPDTITIERHGGSPVVGDRLVGLSLEGLVTGKPRNYIVAKGASLAGRAITVAGVGVVDLAGCDIGRDLDFGHPTKVTSIAPSPASAHAVVRYTAPPGSLPALRVVSLTGETVMSGMLGPGTGVEQSAPIDLQGLRPGYYLLELRVGTQRSSMPVLIER